MKKRLIALLLVLAMVPGAGVLAAEPGFAESKMDWLYACIGGDQILTIESHVSPGGRGGYCQALYAAELTGSETKAELDALAVELVNSGAEPLRGGSKHCYHGGTYTVDPTLTLEASELAPGTYLYVCYSFGCAGGSYNHVLTPYYEKISTMAVRVAERAESLDFHYGLVDAAGNRVAEFEAGASVTVDLNAGPLYLELETGAGHPTERLVSMQAEYPQGQGTEPFLFDPQELRLDPVACGSGSIFITIEPYADGEEARTELVAQLQYPCAPRPEQTVLRESSCKEEGLAAHLCHGYGVSCQTVFDEQVLPAAGHTLFSVSQVLESPTATLPGRGLGTCKVCGEIGVEQEIPPIFSDVVPNGFYSRPLDYCYDQGLVQGITASTFCPDNPCQRAQVVTFLWRAEGCPQPKSGGNPFVDVREGSYYYKAVLWAAENGITKGTDSTHFSPGEPCSRGQVVTLLHRAFGKPQAESQTHPFTDVQAESFYYKAMLWAVENGITSGMTASTFAPSLNCSRAQIVTFLYRAYGA